MSRDRDSTERQERIDWFVWAPLLGAVAAALLAAYFWFLW